MSLTVRRSLSLKTGTWNEALPSLDSERSLVLAFGASSLVDSPEMWRSLRAQYPRSVVVGCSTAGEISGTSVQDDTISVAVTQFDSTDLVVESVQVTDAGESFAAGAKLGAALAKRPGLRAVFLLSEGLKVNGSELVRGCNGAVGPQVIVTGGLSGDGSRFQRTWVGVGDVIASGLIAAVGLYGDSLVVSHGSHGGWDQFGPERVITKSVGNVIFEIDGQPALLLYKKYLGDKAKDLPGSGLLFPLEMRRDESDEKPLVRTLLAVDEAAQSLTFAGDTPQGHRVRLMKANFDRLVDGAATAAKIAHGSLAQVEGSCLAVAVSCVGRRLVLGQRTEEEVEATLGALPRGTEIVGFYSYGELSPYVKGAACELHNQTMTVTTFSEQKTARAATGASPTAQPAGAKAGRETMVTQRRSLSLKSGTWDRPLPALDSERTLVLAFGPSSLLDTPDAWRQLRTSFPTACVVGCSTAGEINGTQVQDDTLSVSITRFQKTDVRIESTMVGQASESFQAGKQLGAALASRPGLRAIFVLSEGLNVNGSELVRGCNSAVGDSVIITGGLSGDGPRFQRTWVAVNDVLSSGQVAAVGFYGDHVLVTHGSRGGWDQFGPERIITKSVGNVVLEIDGQPALDLYKKYLGDKAKDLPGSGLLFPLEIRRDEKDERPLVRTLLAVDEDKQSLTFAGDTPQGYRVRLMKANFDRLVEGAKGAGTIAAEARAKAEGACLAVAVSCVGRRLVLGQRIEEEVEATLGSLPPGTELVGFYSYGELSPYVKGAACELHNQTMTVTTFSEAESALAQDFGDEGFDKIEDDDDFQVVTAVGGGRIAAAAAQRFEYSLKTKTWSANGVEALDSPRTLVVAFGSPGVIDDVEPMRDLKRRFPSSHVVGCSTAGEITGTAVKDDSIVVAAMRFERTDLQTEIARVQDASESNAAGRALGMRLAKTPGLRAVFVLSEGLKVNGSELVRGLNEAVGREVIVTGGLSGDGSRFQRTWVSAQGETASGLVAAVGLYGDYIHVAHGSRGGWDQFGPERVITKSVGNVVFEIDDQPALSLYKKYLGEKAKDLPSSGLLFPLQIRRDETDEQPLVRTLLAVDEANQSLTFAGDTPQGFRVRLMKANFDRLVKGAGDAGDAVQQTWLDQGVKAGAHLAVAISCVGRRLVLDARSEEEVEATVRALPQGTELIGFYSYGELSPFVKDAPCELHNQTMTVTMFTEALRPVVRGVAPVSSLAPPSMTDGQAGVPPPSISTSVMTIPVLTPPVDPGLPAASVSPAPSAAAPANAGGTAPLPPSSSPASKTSTVSVSGQRPRPTADGARASGASTSAVKPAPTAQSSSPSPQSSAVGVTSAVKPAPTAQSSGVRSAPTPAPSTAVPAATPSSAAKPAPTAPTSAVKPAPTAPSPSAATVPPSGASTTPTLARAPTRTDMPARVSKPIAFLPSRGTAANARVVTRRVGAVNVVGITGKLAEGFKGRETARELSGVVVLDLIGVERVTSYGVREWLSFLEELTPRVQQLFLVRCSEAVVAQLGMIRGFTGKGVVLSCLAPFTCSCGAQCNGLMDMRLHGREIARGEVPSPVCPACGNENTQFDDDPRAYFVFQSDRLLSVPPEVDEAIAQLESRAVEAVEKVVDANGTRITVNADLDATIRWQRILDGVEGNVVIDLQRSARTTVEGTAALANAIRAQLGPKDRVDVVAAPQELLTHVESWPRSTARLRVQSAWVEGFCADCNAGRRVLVNVAENLDLLRSGGTPTLLCPRHSQPLDLSRARAVLALLVPQPEPAPAPAAPAEVAPDPVAPVSIPSPPPLPPPTVPPTVASSVPPTPDLAAAPPSPSLPPAPAASTPPSPSVLPTASPAAATVPPTVIMPAPQTNPLLWVAVGALSVALVGSVFLRPSPEPAPAPAPAPAPVAVAPPPPPAPELPPDWASRPLLVEAETSTVWVVGKAGPSRTKEQLLEAATDDAIVKLVAHIERTARPGSPQTGNANDEVFRQRVRRQFDETWGVFAAPVRTELFVTERPDGFSGSFRFKVSTAAVDKAVAELAQSATSAGITVGAARITEAVASQSRETIVVTAVAGLGSAIGVRVGDPVVSIGGVPVRTLRDFEEQSKTAQQRGQLVMVVNREGVLTNIVWRRPTPP
jgi:hypothetical protein